MAHAKSLIRESANNPDLRGRCRTLFVTRIPQPVELSTFGITLSSDQGHYCSGMIPRTERTFSFKRRREPRALLLSTLHRGEYCRCQRICFIAASHQDTALASMPHRSWDRLNEQRRENKKERERERERERGARKKKEKDTVYHPARWVLDL